MENQEKKSFDLRGESKEFAIRSIKMYQYLTETPEQKPFSGKGKTTKSLLPEYNISKMFLMAGTRIGDALRQDNPIEAYHYAKSAKYWLELLQAGGYITQEQGESMLNDCLPLVKILYVKSHPESRKDNLRSASEHLQERKKEGGAE